MTDIERIDQRLSAVERTVADGEFDLEELGELSELTDDLQSLHARVDEFGERIADLEADVQALGGYASEVEHVNTDVERQAYSAYATVDRLEDRIDELESRLESVEDDPRGAASAAATDRQDATGERATDAGDDGQAAADETDGSPDLGPFQPADAEGTSSGDAGDGRANGSSAFDPDVVQSDGGDVDGPGQSDEAAVDQLFETGSEPADAADDDGFFASLRSKFT